MQNTIIASKSLRGGGLFSAGGLFHALGLSRKPAFTLAEVEFCIYFSGSFNYPGYYWGCGCDDITGTCSITHKQDC
ncbi:unknown [Brachyspira sp. CAG:484]|nr:unknown [Brachyspira sp. CAG:484]